MTFNQVYQSWWNQEGGALSSLASTTTSEPALEESSTEIVLIVIWLFQTKKKICSCIWIKSMENVLNVTKARVPTWVLRLSLRLISRMSMARKQNVAIWHLVLNTNAKCVQVFKFTNLILSITMLWIITIVTTLNKFLQEKNLSGKKF